MDAALSHSVEELEAIYPKHAIHHVHSATPVPCVCVSSSQDWRMGNPFTEHMRLDS